MRPLWLLAPAAMAGALLLRPPVAQAGIEAVALLLIGLAIAGASVRRRRGPR